jgi:hypothetical protein
MLSWSFDKLIKTLQIDDYSMFFVVRWSDVGLMWSQRDDSVFMWKGALAVVLGVAVGLRIQSQSS